MRKLKETDVAHRSIPVAFPTAALETLWLFDAEDKYEGECVEHGRKDSHQSPVLFHIKFKWPRKHLWPSNYFLIVNHYSAEVIQELNRNTWGFFGMGRLEAFLLFLIKSSFFHQSVNKLTQILSHKYRNLSVVWLVHTRGPSRWVSCLQECL